MHNLEAYHHADDSPSEILREDGYINHFLEGTNFHTMSSRDELAAGSTKWVLANPGKSWVAYTYDYSESMGVKQIPKGSYKLTWLDTMNGKTVQLDVVVTDESTTWKKPDGFGDEIALSIERAD